jgi:hypothetical protein
VPPEAVAALSCSTAEAVRDRAYRLLAIGLHNRVTHCSIQIGHLQGGEAMETVF